MHSVTRTPRPDQPATGGDQFLEAAKRLGADLSWRKAAVNRERAISELVGILAAGGLRPIRHNDGAISVGVGSEIVIVEIDTFPASPYDRRRAEGGNHAV
jgi:hypothetical protein